MNIERFKRYIFDNIDPILLRDLENSEPGQLSEIVSPARIIAEAEYLAAEYRKEIKLFILAPHFWAETGEPCDINDDFVQDCIGEEMTLRQLFKKLGDKRTPFDFVLKVRKKTVRNPEII
jgi:hypothetical protein